MTQSVLMPTPQPTTQRKKNPLLGDALVVAGGIAGVASGGGMAGASAGASLGGMLADRFGANDMVTEGGGVATPEVNPVQRRLEAQQKDPVQTLREAQAALAYRPPEEQQAYAPALEQALALAQRQKRGSV